MTLTTFTENELRALKITERVCSSLSILGAFTIIGTFLGSSRFRKPINRLVFYASWGNILSNIGTLISLDGIAAGPGSHLCQFQAFMIQWFIIADPFWNLAMAINVHLTVSRKYEATHLRHLEWKYILFAYGLNIIPAVVYFFVKTEARGPVYGPATLWCWIADGWDILRIAVFYIPIWICILLTIGIYIRSGSVIFARRREVQRFGSSERETQISQIDALRTTEVHVTSERADSGATCPPNMYPRRLLAVHIRNGSGPLPETDPAYTVNVETDDGFGTRFVPLGQLDDKIVSQRPLRRATRTDKNAAARAYTKYAMLYFMALLITWVPSTINRVYSFVHPTTPSFGLEFVAASVLPLQGFWQSLIYLAISWTSVLDLFDRLQARIQSHIHYHRTRRIRSYRIGKPTDFVHVSHFNRLDDLHLTALGLRLSQDSGRNTGSGIHRDLSGRRRRSSDRTQILTKEIGEVDVGRGERVSIVEVIGLGADADEITETGEIARGSISDAWRSFGSTTVRD